MEDSSLISRKQLVKFKIDLHQIAKIEYLTLVRRFLAEISEGLLRIDLDV